MSDSYRGEMQVTQGDLTCERCRDLLSSWLDGQRSGASRGDAFVASMVESHLEGCEECAEEARWAAEVDRALQDLQPRRSPETLTARLRAIPDQVQSLPAGVREVAAPPAMSWWQLAATVLVAAGLALLAWRMTSDLASPSGPLAGPTDAVAENTNDDELERQLAAAGYSQADLERAEREARVAFAMLGAFSQRAGLALRDDVLRDQVALAPRRALASWSTDSEVRP